MADWLERVSDESAVAELVAAGKPPILAKLLANRGVFAADVDSFLHPSLSALSRPDELPGISEAAEVAISHVRAGDEIVVFGDYDCDGISASAIAVTALRAVGGKVKPFIPRRMGEGYGMTAASVGRMLEENPGVRLVITVDNGIGSVEEVAGLRSRGVSVVVTDHHLPGETLPEADALVDPKVASPRELENLCGAAVAFFFANRLVARAKALGMYSGPSLGEPLLVLAGLATVTDVMPIRDQNRILVSEALRRFMNPDIRLPGRARRGAPAGLKELYRKSVKTVRPVLAARDFGFALGPRINAVGRLEGEFGTAMDVLRLILSDSELECRELAAKIDECNLSRKGYEQHMTDAAMAMVDPSLGAQVIDFPPDEPMVHPGVAGIVASRVLDRLDVKVPVCVLVGGKGSSRAPAGFNVRDALAECSEYLTHFGGHAAAAGLGLRDGCLDAFRKAFSKTCLAQAESIPPEERAAVRYDIQITTADLSLDVARWVADMEPFGEGNPEPLFAMMGARLAEMRQLGREGKHLSVVLSDAFGSVRGVWWYRGGDIEELRPLAGAPVDALFSISTSDYGGEHVEMRLVAMRKSASGGGGL